MVSFQTGTDEIACEKCGAVHLVSYRDYPEKDRSLIHCKVPGCEGIVIETRSTIEYLSAKLKDGSNA